MKKSWKWTLICVIDDSWFWFLVTSPIFWPTGWTGEHFNYKPLRVANAALGEMKRFVIRWWWTTQPGRRERVILSLLHGGASNRRETVKDAVLRQFYCVLIVLHLIVTEISQNSFPGCDRYLPTVIRASVAGTHSLLKPFGSFLHVVRQCCCTFKEPSSNYCCIGV